jgi:5-methylcytosine-specific restriction endonuclease McrBC regulatory subunit McrC
MGFQPDALPMVRVTPFTTVERVLQWPQPAPGAKAAAVYAHHLAFVLWLHDLLRAVAWVFEAEVRRALSQGIARGYQSREETLAALRGRVDVAAQLRSQQGRPLPLACRFEEYTEDVTLNRVVKAAIDFTVDMNRLFERFVTQVFHDEARRAGWELQAQAPRRLTPVVGMRPDLVLHHAGRDVAVADAKCKLPKHGLPVDDLYQLLAYCVAMHLQSGLLIYAGPLCLERHRVFNSTIHLERAGVDLTGSPDEILRQAMAAAGHAFRAATDAVAHHRLAALR